MVISFCLLLAVFIALAIDNVRLRRQNQYLTKMMGTPLNVLFKSLKRLEETAVTFRPNELDRDFSKNRFDAH